MSSSDDKHAKTEKPTPQRKRKAREEGQIPRSPEVAVAGTFVALIGVLAIGGGLMVDRASGLIRETVFNAGSADALAATPGWALSLFATLAGPFLAAAVVVGLAGGIAQVGVRFNGKLLKPKLSNLDPKRGLERFKPKQAAWELTKTVLKLGAVLGVVYPTMSAWRDHLANDRTLAGAIDRLSDAYGAIITRAALLALVIAAADFTFQRFKTNRKLMMSRREIQREHRDNEGDPHQKAARKQRQQEFSRNRMVADTATADVLITNPTHLVVALRYEPDDGAPRVIAKGADHLAERLRSVARRHGVPVTSDVPLARALYRRCRVGQYIPVELYHAVAVVLAAAYRRSGRGPGSRQRPTSRTAA